LAARAHSEGVRNFGFFFFFFFVKIELKQSESHREWHIVGRHGGTCHYIKLHGLTDDASMWLRRSRIEWHVRNLPLIVVMPDGYRGFYTKNEQGPDYAEHIGVELPAMIEMDAVGAMASLLLKRSIAPASFASGQAPRSSASFFEAASATKNLPSSQN